MNISKKYLLKIIKEECEKILEQETATDSEEGDKAGMAALDKDAEEERRKGLSKMSSGIDIAPHVLRYLKKAHEKYNYIMHNRDRVHAADRVNAEAILHIINAVELLNDPSVLKK